VRAERFFARFAVFSAVLLWTVAAWGQATTSLRGTVTDPSGAAVPGAKISLVEPATGMTRTTTSGADGTYVFTELQPGTFQLTVEATGFQTYQQKGVVLRVSLPATVNVRLVVGAVTQVVSVSGQAPLLNTTDASIGQTMGTQQIEQLPLEARNVPGLLSVQPGVIYTSDRNDRPTWDTRSGAVNGERSDQNNITLDGVDVNDQFAAAPFSTVLPVTVDSVQEFRVTTSNYGANEGRSAGAQMQLVTKGGTNNFHGSLYEYNRSAAGEANDFFIKSAQAASGDPNKPPKLIRNIFGGSIGGPFMKNRFFFFFNYEGRRDAQAESAVRTVPSATLRDGIIQYLCQDVNGNGTSTDECPGGSVMGKSGQTYTVDPGNNAIGPAQLTQMDPLGIGPNTASLAYFNSYPLPNDPTVGDGLNYVGFRFAAPVRRHYNWMIGRLDYKITANGNHSLFFRGSGKNDTIDQTPFLPGTPPETSQKNLSKGFVVGYTGIFGAHWVNNFRYGLTRESLGTAGNSNAPWIYMRGLDQGVFRSTQFTLPVHNFVDDVSWTMGSHNIQFGANIWLIRRNSASTENSFSFASTNAAWLTTVGIANTSTSSNPTPFDPAGANLPLVDGGFDNSFDFPLIAMIGATTEVDAVYNFHLNPDFTGTPITQGDPVPRHYKVDEYDLYWQDTWQVRPNLTFTYGVRYALMGPIGETAGQQVSPTFSLGQWFNQRGINMRQGIPASADKLVEFAPAGPSYGRPGYYGWQTRNFAPRIAFAWTPRPSMNFLQKIFGNGDKTVIRAGFGMFHDHFGPEMANTFDTNGAFGLGTTLTNPAAIQTLSSAPRLAGLNDIPTTDQNGKTIFLAAPPAVYPQTFPDTLDTGGFAIAWGMDSSLRTPYSYALDLSVQRQLPGNMSLDVAYVGHLAHRLMVQADLGMPSDLTDPKTGIDYFTAAARFTAMSRAGVDPTTVDASTIGPTAQFWNDMIAPNPPNSDGQVLYGYCTIDGSTTNMLAAMYDLFNCFPGNETTSLFVLDLYGYPAEPIGGLNSYYNPQYSSLYSWRSIGWSNYHALQVSLQKRMSHGLSFDFNYTFSKSLDLESDAQTVGFVGGIGAVINSWDPSQNYGPSTFDLRHQINADWILQLPFGRGREFGGNVGNAIDAVIGGWQVSGLTRWSTGFPVNVGTCFCFPTNWELTGFADLTGKPIKTGKSIVNGNYNMFPDPAAAAAGFDVPVVGQTGVRNAIRGDGYGGLDMGLSKTWHMPYNDSHTLQFRWDVFNVMNLKRFDVQTASLELDHANTFGKYTQLLTNPRVMQFALRYQF
jgi:hypothetical protein